jgi:hypothetical protein
MPSIRRVMCASLVTVALACHHAPATGARPTPSDSLATIAVTRPVCTTPATMTADPGDVRWPVGQLTVPESLATTDTARTVAIRLPSQFQPTSARHPERHRWASPDSSAIELWLSETPVSSVGGSSVAQFGGEEACTMTIGGHAQAIVIRYWMILTGHPDTLYNAATAAIIAPSQAVDAVITSPTRPARDALLSAVADLEISK